MNKSERAVREAFQATGDYETARGGWPDFLIRHKRTGRLFGVEVKSPRDRLTGEQEHIHDWLREAGIEVLVLESDGASVDLEALLLAAPGWRHALKQEGPIK